jgi:hypothetical protein
MFLTVFGTCVDTVTKQEYDDFGCCGLIGWCCVFMFSVAGNPQCLSYFILAVYEIIYFLLLHESLS